MFLKSEMLQKMDELKRALTEGTDLAGRDIQGALDKLQSADVVWSDKINAINEARDKLDDAERTANEELRASLKEIFVDLTTIKLGMGTPPKPKEKAKDEQSETDRAGVVLGIGEKKKAA